MRCQDYFHPVKMELSISKCRKNVELHDTVRSWCEVGNSVANFFSGPIWSIWIIFNFMPWPSIDILQAIYVFWEHTALGGWVFDYQYSKKMDFQLSNAVSNVYVRFLRMFIAGSLSIEQDIVQSLYYNLASKTMINIEKIQSIDQVGILLFCKQNLSFLNGIISQCR